MKEFVALAFNLVVLCFLACIVSITVSNSLDIKMITDNFTQADLNTKLKILISQNKIISAKEYFGMMSSVYNNIFVTLICILGLSAMLGFIYIKNKTEEQMKEQIEKYMKKSENVKPIANDIFAEKFQDLVNKELGSKLDILESRINELSEKIDDIRKINQSEKETKIPEDLNLEEQGVSNGICEEQHTNTGRT